MTLIPSKNLLRLLYFSNDCAAGFYISLIVKNPKVCLCVSSSTMPYNFALSNRSLQ